MLLTSAIHFADNAFRLDLYPGPVWFNPTLVLMAWLVLPVLALAAYRIGTRASLTAYGLLGFSGFAHYLPLHVHRVPLRCLVTIAWEAIASAVLIAYVLLREPVAQLAEKRSRDKMTRLPLKNGKYFS
jgi:hypothetical protein